MRIVAGKHRSRRLESLAGDATRPTLDKVKEAVFSSLGTYFDGGWVLDLFGGSGSIGLEAISRGMEHAVFADRSYDAVQIIRRNIAALKEEDHTTVWKLDYKKALQRCLERRLTFDLIYLDPPYAAGYLQDCISRIEKFGLLKDSGTLVCECRKEEDLTWLPPECSIRKEATYGIMKVVYIRKETL